MSQEEAHRALPDDRALPKDRTLPQEGSHEEGLQPRQEARQMKSAREKITLALSYRKRQ